jgi:proteic killer suppression protein
LHCHPLKGERQKEWAITLKGFYRLIFTLEGQSLEIVRIQEVSKHYGD